MAAEDIEVMAIAGAQREGPTKEKPQRHEFMQGCHEVAQGFKFSLGVVFDGLEDTPRKGEVDIEIFLRKAADKSTAVGFETD
jgi:hypothetical protein